jgi:hypothetical protein
MHPYRLMTARPGGIKLHAELCHLLGTATLSYAAMVATVAARLQGPALTTFTCLATAMCAAHGA